MGISRASFGLAVLGLLVPALARGAGPEQNDVPAIYGGQPAPACGWPTTIALDNCSGTLVHPEVVAYAAHCGAGQGGIRFGNSQGAPDRFVAVQYCATHPNASGQVDEWDSAYCRLVEPVTDVEPTPPVMGCEEDLLTKTTPVVIAGFGQSDFEGWGTKRYAETIIVDGPFPNGLVHIGADGKTVCYGDSGGSTFWQAPDGGWRSVAITSGIGNGCGTGVGIHVMLSQAVPWFEEHSGVDVTPCTDVEGTWDPGPDCTGFARSPGQGGGTWQNGCATGDVTGPVDICGPNPNLPEMQGPNLVITAPDDGTYFPDAPAEVQIDVDADDGDGWKVMKVWLAVNGEEQPAEDFEPPFSFGDAAFPKGTWEITALGEDYWGNVGESAPVTLYVGVEPPEEETGSDDSSDSSSGDPGEDSGEEETDSGAEGSGETGETSSSGEPGQDGEPSGCACGASARSGSALWALGLFLAARRRERGARDRG